MNERFHQSIGVFDSGLGGISVLKELYRMLPHENYIYFGDSRYAPYGEKSKGAIMERCITICEFFLRKGVKAIVIACNTATSACVNELRIRYPHLIIIGMEPALKVAAECEGKQHVLVLATNFTLREKKFASLMSRYEQENCIYKQACPKLVEIVEGHQLYQGDFVRDVLHGYIAPYNLDTLNSIVLGCTHFVFFRAYLQELLPSHISVVDGNYGTAKHLANMLHEQQVENDVKMGNISIYNSLKDDENIINLSKELLNV